MPQALERALAHGDSALVESYVELGREVRCGIVVRDGELVCLPLEEYAVDTVNKPIRDERDKLGRTADGQLYLVAKERHTRGSCRPTTRSPTGWPTPHAAVTSRWGAATTACSTSASTRRVQPWFLEAGPYCSYAPTSVIAVMAAAAGMDVTDLIESALRELGMDRTPC